MNLNYSDEEIKEITHRAKKKYPEANVRMTVEIMRNHFEYMADKITDGEEYNLPFIGKIVTTFYQRRIKNKLQIVYSTKLKRYPQIDRLFKEKEKSAIEEIVNQKNV